MPAEGRRSCTAMSCSAMPQEIGHSHLGALRASKSQSKRAAWITIGWLVCQAGEWDIAELQRPQLHIRQTREQPAQAMHSPRSQPSNQIVAEWLGSMTGSAGWQHTCFPSSSEEALNLPESSAQICAGVSPMNAMQRPLIPTS